MDPSGRRVAEGGKRHTRRLEALVAANDVKVEDAKARLRAEVDGGDLEAASKVVVELNFYGKIEGEALAKADGEGWSVAFGDRRRGM